MDLVDDQRTSDLKEFLDGNFKLLELILDLPEIKYFDKMLQKINLGITDSKTGDIGGSSA